MDADFPESNHQTEVVVELLTLKAADAMVYDFKQGVQRKP
jgi:hypothetical protein